jgi:hypothetical protein
VSSSSCWGMGDEDGDSRGHAAAYVEVGAAQTDRHLSACQEGQQRPPAGGQLHPASLCEECPGPAC